MTPELITALLGTGGLALIIPKVIEGIRAWRSGRALEEKSKNKSLVTRLSESESHAESETRWRRKLEEYAGALRVDLITHGVPEEDLRPWPKRTIE